MKFAPVLPTRLYQEIDHGSYHMVQAHLIENNKQEALFTEWSERADHLVIMDNGMIELGEAAAGTLLSTATLIMPDEIICPDAANDKDKTIELCRTYVHECSTCCKRVMLVPQGRDVVEWCHCCAEMLSMTESIPVSIGVTKLISQYPGGRFAALAWLYNHINTYGFEGIQENVHLLGLDIGVQEYMHLQAYFPQLRGCDSTWPYAAARQGEYVHFSSRKPEMKEEYWHSGVASGVAFGNDEEVLWRTRINIAMMKAFLGMEAAVTHVP